jgi:hypothetical protein
MSEKLKESRLRWMSWTDVQREQFLLNNQFNPRFQTYAWQMLPYSIQVLLSVIDTEKLSLSDVGITGQCSSCNHVYKITEPIVCPSCGWSGLTWAFHGKDADPDPLGELTEGDRKDITELKRMFDLKGDDNG